MAENILVFAQLAHQAPDPLATHPVVVSMYATNAIAGGLYVAFSDQRTKRIGSRSDAARDLATLADLEVTDYLHIDTPSKGSGKQKKLIAQQVEKVYPQAVSRSTDVVPDIYQRRLLSGAEPAYRATARAASGGHSGDRPPR